MKKVFAAWFVGVGLLCVVAAGLADEGMWTFDHPPVARIAQDHGVTLTPEWLAHLQRSSVRLNDGSASFVSANGLILTNHHVVTGCVRDVSDEAHDYLADGYGTARPLPEKRCPGQEARVLESTVEVTAQVHAAIAPDRSEAEAVAARRATLANLEKECREKTGLFCEAVTLHGGGQYWLYRYRLYRDVRLVFAPEMQLAFFGGDPDNFNFPRFCLDFALLRAYDDQGRPARPAHHLTLRPSAINDGELLFVSGHPASSQRFYTMAQLEFLRDYAYPFRVAMLRRVERALRDYAGRGPEQARRAQSSRFYVDNSIKAYEGNIRGLRIAEFMDKKRAAENALRARVAADARLMTLAGGAWDEIARAQETFRGFYRVQRLLRHSGSDLLDHAAQIVRLTAELTKPNEQRLEEYQDDNLEAVHHELYADAPIYADLEEVLLTEALDRLRVELGENHPTIRELLRGRLPADVAREAVAGSRLYKPADRKTLAESGAAAVASSTDPVVRLARVLDPLYRETRRRYEEEVEIVEDRAGLRIAQVQFAASGADTYPDATFTLRLAYGRSLGYETGGYRVPYMTTFHGLFNRHASFGGRAPYDLPPRWRTVPKGLNPATQLDVVNTADIFGGNSGSPAVDVDGRIAGLIFDGNLQSLDIEFVYDDAVARAIVVSTPAILESLRHVYKRDDLLRELAPGF